jgi:hypothetical protein
VIGHLGVLGLPVDPPLGRPAAGADQSPAIARAHVGVDLELAERNLVLPR